MPVASSAWPVRTAPPSAALTIEPAPDTGRTQYEDGPVRQGALFTNPWWRRQAECEVDGADMAAVDDFLEAHAAAGFAWRDHDGRWRPAWVVGGYGGVRWRQESRRTGPARWALSMTVEGPRGEIVYLAREILTEDLRPILIPDGRAILSEGLVT